MVGPPVAVAMACRQIISELCAEYNNMKIFKDLSKSKNMAFNVK
jgi:hypothetical protein